MKHRTLLMLNVCLLFLFLPGAIRAQTTISTGSVQGTITDPSGAVVPGARVSVTNRATGQVTATTTSSAGTYTSGALNPGEYTLTVETRGFKTLDTSVSIEVGVTTPGNFALQLGTADQVVEVGAGTLRVNTEQAGVQGVLSSQQLENLPVNGRNFLDLAQLEPAVQIQDGGTFDPTKKGFFRCRSAAASSVPRASRLTELIQATRPLAQPRKIFPWVHSGEFELGRSMLDLSTELTSSGSVNVVTKSGTNSYHGQGD